MLNLKEAKLPNEMIVPCRGEDSVLSDTFFFLLVDKGLNLDVFETNENYYLGPAIRKTLALKNWLPW